MVKQTVLMMGMATLLSACVSGSDFAHLQSQVTQLDAKLRTAENQLQVLQKELTVVKGQRVVRLPTGAPTTTRRRSSQQPDYAMSEQERLFNTALNHYKGGNIQSAIQQFEQFAGQYPNDKHYAQALYYLGEANYTLRQYDKAQQVLEVLVYQTPSAEVSPGAVALLEKVYRGKGDNTKLSELNNFKQNLSSPGLEKSQ